MTEKPQDSAAHEEFTELFSDYYDDELDADARAAVDAHFASCSPCRAAYEDFVAPLDAMRGLDFTFAPDDFVRDVTTSINRQTRGTFFADTWLFGFRVPFEAFAAVILAVFGALYLLGTPSQPQLVVTDAPGESPAPPHAPADDVLGSALGSSTTLQVLELPDAVDLATLAAQLRASGFAVRADISQGEDALLVTVAADDLGSFRARVRALTGIEPDSAPRLEPGVHAVTVRLVKEAEGTTLPPSQPGQLAPAPAP